MRIRIVRTSDGFDMYLIIFYFVRVVEFLTSSNTPPPHTHTRAYHIYLYIYARSLWPFAPVENDE